MRTLISSLVASALVLGASVASAQDVGLANLVVNFGDRAEKYPLAVTGQPITVEAMMQTTLPKPKEGPAFSADWYPNFGSYVVTAIGGVANKGDLVGWLYCVNSALAEKGISIQTLKAGDTATFKYGEYSAFTCD